MEGEQPDMMRLAVLLKDAAAVDAEAGMKPFLADRLMRRLANERSSAAPQEEIWQALLWIFKPVATVCLLLVIILTAHNLYVSSQFETQGSTVESLLALPEINTVAALELDLTSYEEPISP